MSDKAVETGGSDKPRRRWAATVALSVLGVILAGLMVYWLKPPVDATRDFKVPKLTSAFVDGEPFMRLQLAPGDAYRPIEVMEGTNIKVECFAVKTESTKLRFSLEGFGRKVDSADCVFNVDVTDAVGSFSDLRISYHDGDTQLIDTLTIPVVVVAKSERIEFHQLQDANHQPVAAGGVPDRIFVYGRAITNLPGDTSEYGALFFVADPANDVPVVQMMPLLQGDQPKPMIGRIVKYRNYGKDLYGYAMWSPEPVNISPIHRTITDLYIGIFKLADIDQIFSKLLKVEITGPDSVMVTPQVASPYDVMQMTVGQKLLSESFHVVAGAGRAKIDERVKATAEKAIENIIVNTPKADSAPVEGAPEPGTAPSN
ncbi:MAG TPA: hypothetical protein PKH54_10705 [Myxococcota bacterium]|nr:hypothetical protein [Myxococcota bacterium]HPV04953.1 hypothetical protein [Myxococcota bacterium]